MMLRTLSEEIAEINARNPNPTEAEIKAEEHARWLEDTQVRVSCGSTHPDPHVEARVEAMRESEGVATEAGCGSSMHWTVAYRCVECGRWFHRDCIRRHFSEP